LYLAVSFRQVTFILSDFDDLTWSLVMIRFPCPSCHKTLKAPDDAVGVKTCCPHCYCATRVPDRGSNGRSSTNGTATNTDTPLHPPPDRKRDKFLDHLPPIGIRDKLLLLGLGGLTVVSLLLLFVPDGAHPVISFFASVSGILFGVSLFSFL